MDFLDEQVEFKPLTKGLGFHHKTVNLKAEVEKSELAREKLARTLPSQLPEDLEFAEGVPPHLEDDYLEGMKEFDDLIASADQVLQNLGIEDQEKVSLSESSVSVPTPVISEESLALDLTSSLSEALFEPLPVVEKKALKSTKKKENRKKISLSDRGYLRWSLPAMILDGIVVTALSLAFVMALLLVTKVNFLQTLTYGGLQGSTIWSLALLFIFVTFVYMVSSRSFFGFSLGEWTFEMRLGQPSEFERTTYPLHIMLRTLLSWVGVVFLLPLWTFLFSRDFVGSLCGLRLQPLRVYPKRG